MQVASFCCELSLRFPHIQLQETGKETIASFLSLRSDFIAQGKAQPTSTGDSPAQHCMECPQYQLGTWHPSGKITMVHFSMTPAPCQGRCIYCEVVKMPRKFNDPITQESYRRAFEALEYADQRGLIAPDAEWLISSGEISIHPFQDRIFDMVEEKNVTFFSNVFKYNERMGSILAHNPEAKIELSIDSGTPGSWKRVKQHDNFEDVINNLDRYHHASMRAGQIILKYILLPGLNDTQEDLDGIIEIMKRLDVSNLVISRERRSYDLTDEEHADLMSTVTRFARTLKANDLSYSLHSFSPQERRMVNSAV